MLFPGGAFRKVRPLSTVGKCARLNHGRLHDRDGGFRLIWRGQSSYCGAPSTTAAGNAPAHSLRWKQIETDPHLEVQDFPRMPFLDIRDVTASRRVPESWASSCSSAKLYPRFRISNSLIRMRPGVREKNDSRLICLHILFAIRFTVSLRNDRV